MARSVKEWRGRSDDHKPPPTVRQRILDRNNGTCHLCSQPITDRNWDADHVVALINGGENAEANMKPAHRQCHRLKTAKDVAEKAMVAQKRMKHSGAIQPKQTIQGRNSLQTRKDRPPKPRLPPARLYAPTREIAR